MREIKFRAWDKEEKEMHKDIQEVDGIEVVVLNSKNEMVQSQPEYMHQYFNNVDYDLMQYTGLKDKNGAEIYENDIVKHFNHTYRVEKSFSGEFVGKRNKSGELNIVIAYTSPECEVVGNIYENQEILEGLK